VRQKHVAALVFRSVSSVSSAGRTAEARCADCAVCITRKGAAAGIQRIVRVGAHGPAARIRGVAVCAKPSIVIAVAPGAAPVLIASNQNQSHCRGESDECLFHMLVDFHFVSNGAKDSLASLTPAPV